MKKPRPYDGPVGWLDQARATAGAWPDETLGRVMAASPYGDTPAIRPLDWAELVAHVSLRKGEDPITTAERLAQYVAAYRERYQQTLSPVQVKETQR